MSLVLLLKENANQIGEEATLLLEDTNIKGYIALGHGQLLLQYQKTADMFISSIESGHDAEFVKHIDSVGHESAVRGFYLSDAQQFISTMREAALNCVEKNSTDSTESLKYSRIIMKLVDKARLTIGEAFLAAREEIIVQQKIALQELSTPVIPIFDNILIVPLIGAIDTARARDIVENLLQGIVKEQAKIAIIDVTGVPTIDTNIGHHLIKAVQAGRLLGCTCILVGIRPVVAQTIIHLGIDFSNIPTKQSLHQGLEYAFKLLKLEIKKNNADV